jgi:hypothetical protein
MYFGEDPTLETTSQPPLKCRCSPSKLKTGM